MASRREEVIQAVVDLVQAALPDAEVKRDAPWPSRSEPGGLVIIRDGDPGEPEECFSPRAFTYRHEIPVEVFAPEAVADRHKALDDMITALGVAVDANRTLGGLCDWLEGVAPSPEDIASSASQPVRAALVPLMAEYTTSNPLA